MFQKKLEFIRGLLSCEEFLSLNLDTAKLYLILVIKARWPERRGRVSFETVRRVLGDHFTLTHLEKALSTLSDRGFIQFHLVPPRQRSPLFNYKPQIYYRIKGGIFSDLKDGQGDTGCNTG